MVLNTPQCLGRLLLLPFAITKTSHRPRYGEIVASCKSISLFVGPSGLLIMFASVGSSSWLSSSSFLSSSSSFLLRLQGIILHDNTSYFNRNNWHYWFPSQTLVLSTALVPKRCCGCPHVGVKFTKANDTLPVTFTKAINAKNISAKLGGVKFTKA